MNETLQASRSEQDDPLVPIAADIETRYRERYLSALTAEWGELVAVVGLPGEIEEVPEGVEYGLSAPFIRNIPDDGIRGPSRSVPLLCRGLVAGTSEELAALQLLKSSMVPRQLGGADASKGSRGTEYDAARALVSEATRAVTISIWDATTRRRIPWLRADRPAAPGFLDLLIGTALRRDRDPREYYERKVEEQCRDMATMVAILRGNGQRPVEA